MGLGSRQGNFSLGGVTSRSYAKRDAPGQTRLKTREVFDGFATGGDNEGEVESSALQQREAARKKLMDRESKLRDDVPRGSAQTDLEARDEISIDGLSDFDDEDEEISSSGEGEQEISRKLLVPSVLV